MDAVAHDAEPEAEAEEASSSRGGRWARLLDSRRRRRRRLAGVLAALGVAAVVVGLSWHPGASPEPKPQGARVSDAGGSVTVDTGKPATNGPGGVGTNPQKTGLPAVPPEGGKVRTGTKEEGCFNSLREYLDAWDRTGQEPDPCFVAQTPSEQPQPDGVVRSYNGEKF